MKNFTLTIIAIAAFATTNAQMITRSSIASMVTLNANDAGVVSQTISRMTLVAALPEVEVSFDEVVAEVKEVAAINLGTLNAYPNPAVNNINFNFELTETGNVTVAVYNVTGQKVSDVYSTNYAGGSNTQQIDLSSYTSGIYFISLNITSDNGNTNTITKKIQVIK